MTDVPAPRASNLIALIFAILGFVIAAGLAGIYIWDRQQKDRENTATVIDQLRRIDDRLTKLESGQAAQDITALTEKIDQIAIKLSEVSASDSGAISQQLQIMIEHQIKLQNDLAALKETHAAAQASAQVQNNLAQHQQILLRDLQSIAPALLMPVEQTDLWSKIKGAFQRWITVRPQPSANADTTTTSGKVSRALYDLEQGDVMAALQVLPDDPRLSSFRATAQNYLDQEKSAEITAPKPAETKLQLQPLPEPVPGETP